MVVEVLFDFTELVLQDDLKNSLASLLAIQPSQRGGNAS